MERCRFAGQRLSLYLDSQCTAKERMAVKEHLYTCKNCQEELVLLNTARLALKSFSYVKLPPELDKIFITRLDQQKPTSNKK